MSKKSVWTKARKEAIKFHFRGWLDAMQIPYTKLHWHWCEEDHEEDATGNGETTFAVKGGFPYKWISLWCYPPAAAKEMDDEAINQDLLHEAIHIIHSPMVDKRLIAQEHFTDFHEMVTEHITAWVWNMYTNNRSLSDELEEMKKKRNKRRKRP